MQTRAAIDSLYRKLAERVGFEPTNTVRCYTLSRRAPSTARPPLHKPLLKLYTGRDCSPLRRQSLASLRTDAFESSKIAPGDFVEPTNTVRCYTLSRRSPSTARPPLHKPYSAPAAGWDGLGPSRPSP